MSAPAKIKKRRSWLGLLIPALLAFAVLVALGTWQIERKAWKEGLIAVLTERLAAPPSALPAPSTWPSLDQASEEYRRVKFSATFDHGKESLVYAAASAFRPDVAGPGYWIFTPARLTDGGFVIVNRGFVPRAPQGCGLAGRRPDRGPGRDRRARCAGRRLATGFHRPTMPCTICGSPATRWPSPTPRACARWRRFTSSRNRRFRRVDLPQPGKLAVRLRNEHLQYALTWYGLALVLVVVFVAWTVKSGRENAAQHRQSPSSSL